MARTQAPDYHDRRLAIVEAAARLFAERGYAGASVADLAAACGASKSLIYHYFPSKEDILFEVMDEHIRGLIEAMRTVEAAGGSPPERLKALGHALMARYVGAEARHKVLLNDLSRLPEAPRRKIVGEQRQLIAFVEEVIGAERSDLDRPHRRAAAMLYFGALNWTHTWHRPDGPVGPDAIADMAAAMVLGGAS